MVLSSLSHAQQSVPFADGGGVDLNTDAISTADSGTQPTLSFTSISTVIVTELSTVTPPPPQESPPFSNTSAPSTSSSGSTSSQPDVVHKLNISTEVSVADLSTNQPGNESITEQKFSTDLPTTELMIDESNSTTTPATSLLGQDSTTLPSLPSFSNSSDGMATTQTTLLNSIGVTDNDTMSMTTTADDLVTYELVTERTNPIYEDMTTAASDEGIFTESFLRLLIIAGATAGSCLVLLIVVFIIVACCHRRRQRKKNSRYYEFKKKDFSSKYEKVEQKNSLARRDHADGNTPIGGGWVFNSSGYHGEYEDETAQNVALRSISPLAVATPLLKVSPVEDQNGIPDSGHGGSITAEDSALGLSPSLEEDIELELSPLYKALGHAGTSIGTGSEVRDHSYIGGDSDTISEGNEPVDDAPIRDVLFNSFGANRAASEDAVEL
ncbi:uncharacterized protein LOC121431245 [Lytechinus variegatus]|uniref:uncharacterized protein LOC121431245 n=1 Tax=Lytechinus variegatus TaxID=7654 RepID=UPI001BB139FB|nr:uncharacterized protein LOC121431245 [Lytechinus variegatus]